MVWINYFSDKKAIVLLNRHGVVGYICASAHHRVAVYRGGFARAYPGVGVMQMDFAVVLPTRPAK